MRVLFISNWMIDCRNFGNLNNDDVERICFGIVNQNYEWQRQMYSEWSIRTGKDKYNANEVFLYFCYNICAHIYTKVFLNSVVLISYKSNVN